MKTDFQAKYLQYLNQKKQEEGFTLIELLVVIIIIGILAAIALPSFLNQANKAKQSEAKTYVGSMNRAQQAFNLENNYFANQNAFGQLGLGIASETANYQYQIAGGADEATYQTAPGASAVTNQARQKTQDKSPLKAYIGGVNIGTITATSETTSLAVMCEGTAAGVNGGALGTEETTYTKDGPPACPANYKIAGGKTSTN